ncbi:MAG: class I SAM-dependent methyltransferase [Pseudomonadota bacterium]|nr:class I SAM-dependent methyltransferase [Pseudomonadota bacterium]
MTLPPFVYDALPYTCTAMPYAHPERLATIATLSGMQPAPVSTSRILELACGDGSHLIATAYTLPKAHCIGIDLSRSRIAQGQHLIEQLGLTNITLKVLNILEVDAQFGQFDYIIAHGIYTWVAKSVQKKILAICRHHLAPQGVAYISYYTQPGWFIQGIMADLMRYHLQVADNTALAQLFTALTRLSGQSQEVYSRFLHQSLTELMTLPAEYLFQQLVAEDNQPLYFYEFMEQAHAQGLAYLGDAFLGPPRADSLLTALSSDLLAQEQYSDILRQRQFRHTLLCQQTSSLSRTLSPQVIKQCYVAFRGDWRPYDNPSCHAALDYLAQQWPLAISVAQLHAQWAETALITVLFEGYLQGQVECFTEPPPFVTTLSPAPKASALARWQAQQGKPRLTNQRCESLSSITAFSRWLLPYLDGQHDRQALLEQLEQEGLNDTGAQQLDEALQQLAQAALLIG